MNIKTEIPAFISYSEAQVREIDQAIKALLVTAEQALIEINQHLENYKSQKKAFPESTDAATARAIYDHNTQLVMAGIKRIKAFDEDVPKEKRVKADLQKIDQELGELNRALVEALLWENQIYLEKTKGPTTLNYTFDSSRNMLQYAEPMKLGGKASSDKLYSSIQKHYQQYLKIEGSQLEQKRRHLFKLRGLVQQWLQVYLMPSSTKKRNGNYRTKVLKLEQILIDDLQMMSHYQVATDTYLEIRKRFGVLQNQMNENRYRWILQEVPLNADEPIQKAIESENQKIELARKPFEAKSAELLILASQWKKQHQEESEAFSIQKKRREMTDMIRAIKLFADDLNISFTSLNEESQQVLNEKWGLKDYVETEDPIFKAIQVLVNKIESFNENFIGQKK
ncbi:MAG: hypothetical protein AAFV80_20445, partial [Bacteroidota bacterium]